MNIEQLNWIDGLDQTGWIAIALFAVFFIIVAFAIAMMLKLNAENKRHQQKKSLKESQSAASKSARPVPSKTEVKNTENKNEDSNPLEEAEVFLTYGLKKQAADLLEKYLEKNPSDKTAHEMLRKAQASTQQ